MKKLLLPWQAACLAAWEANNFSGIAHVVTGAGKTFLAIAAIRRLLDETCNLKVKIVVPKNFLMYQWHGMLMAELGFLREDIGFFSGTHKSTPDKQVMLYVINSARNVLARQIVEDTTLGHKVLLVADECHHYGSSVNSGIFAYANHLQAGAKVYTLGLSATPWCTNYNEVLVPALGPEIYNFGFFAALKANIISKFALFNIRIPFNAQERRLYDELSDQLSYTLHRLNELCPYLGGGRLSSYSFFAMLEDIVQNGEPKAANLAKTVLILTMQRKELVYHARYRVDAVVELVRRIPKSSKIIIFGERIETAEEIGRRLGAAYHNEVGLYHSKVPKPLGVHILRQFMDGDIRVLVTCKTLDEGLNIAETDVGIVVSSTGSRRQRVQRLGRVLRRKEDEKAAYFYYLFVGDTTEEDELLREIVRPEFDSLINRIDLVFDEEAGLFENPHYSLWEERVVEHMLENNCTAEEIVEFMRNTDRGILSEDWLMDEATCLRKLNTASGRACRNYLIAILMIIRARIKR